MQHLRVNPRVEYRERHASRVDHSVSLAIAYPELRSLTVDGTYSDRETVMWGHGFKYRVNLNNARSIFLLNCPSRLCIGGDFNLSKGVARAVAARRTKVTGDIRCHGSRRSENGELICCESVLHYKLSLAYKERRKPSTSTQSRRCLARSVGRNHL
jgi:hypothetical protein